MCPRVLATAAVFVALGACGCGVAYQDGRSAAAAISLRSAWKVTGDMRSVGYAIDQDVTTAAISSSADNKGMLTIDLGKPCLFNMVVIDHGGREKGFARRVAVLTSIDGEIFTHHYAGPGTRKVTILWLGAPTLARYVRLQTLVGGDEPWSVAEVHLQ